jgi:hypothetical protein
MICISIDSSTAERSRSKTCHLNFGFRRVHSL